ncbi:hypothetical protein [Echinicola jeungdonensis]|uniref:hypothetical protein n=1 Tax=Echinicola jeungdonensis TaxID=709343 RepID=UPI00338FCF73
MPGSLQAQQNEYGLGLGVATYSGDIIRRVDPGQIGLQGTFFAGEILTMFGVSVLGLR